MERRENKGVQNGEHAGVVTMDSHQGKQYRRAIKESFLSTCIDPSGNSVQRFPGKEDAIPGQMVRNRGNTVQ